MAAQKDARDAAARAAVRPWNGPVQLAGGARLLPLTPELLAHYGELPTPEPEEAPDA